MVRKQKATNMLCIGTLLYIHFQATSYMTTKHHYSHAGKIGKKYE